MLHVIIMTLAPIFFITMLGPLAERMRAIDDHHVGELNALVMDFALPASLFVATASSSRSEMMSQGPLFANTRCGHAGFPNHSGTFRSSGFSSIRRYGRAAGSDSGCPTSRLPGRRPRSASFFTGEVL
jgi:hypothetical protein